MQTIYSQNFVNYRSLEAVRHAKYFFFIDAFQKRIFVLPVALTHTQNVLFVQTFTYTHTRTYD